MNIKYRTEIDGLRAIAVIPVVFYHAEFFLFKGGFVGVDVFFVISGYLITSLILKEIQNKSFSLSNFYIRRIRRILPALFFVVITTSILSFIFLTRTELGNYFRSVIATNFFYSNFFFWKTVPYFEAEAKLEPLLHTWSLSIEEQFYILFPIFLIFVYKFFRDKIYISFLIIFFSSLAFCHWAAINTSGVLNFYFSPSRAWELCLGCIAAYIYLKKNKKYVNFKYNNLLSFFGIFLILFSIFFFNDEILYPSLYTLIPTLGTFLIILYSEKSFLKIILSNRIVVFVGLISFSFYLWHQPLLVFGKIYFENFNTQIKFILICISLLLSYLTWQFVEKKFRNKDIVSSKLIINLTILILIILFLFSFLNIKIFNSSSYQGTESKKARLLKNREYIYLSKIDDRQFNKFRIIYENLKPDTLVVGSSRTMNIGNEVLKENVFNMSVSGASIEDHITLILMALEKFKPKKIILGLDPWLMNKNNYQFRWKSLSKEYELAKKIIENPSKKRKVFIFTESKNKNLYEEIIDKLYSYLNIRSFEIYEKNKQNINKPYIKRDGSRHYPQKKSEIIPKVIDYSMNDYEFSNINHRMYSKFIKYLKSKKIELVIILSPYHQKSYDMTLKKNTNLVDLEKIYLNIAKENSIKTLGSYNSHKVGCLEEEFYDYMHFDIECTFKNLKYKN